MPTKPVLERELRALRQQLQTVMSDNEALTYQLDNQAQAAIHRPNAPTNVQHPPSNAQQQPNQQDQYLRLTQPREFEYEPDSSNDYATKWKTWIRRFDKWLLSSGLSNQTDDRKINILTTTAGEQIEELCNVHAPTATTYDEVKNALNSYFAPIKETMFETIQFRTLNQRSNEPIDEFVQRLRVKANNCAFANNDHEIYLQMMTGCISTEIRKQAIQGASRTTPLSLHELINAARLEEVSQKQASLMNPKRHEAAHLKRHNPKQQQLRRFSKDNYETNTRASTANKPSLCNNCGYDHVNKPCPATGKTCKHCQKTNHFASVCRSRLTGKPPTNNQARHHTGKPPYKPKFKANAVNILEHPRTHNILEQRPQFIESDISYTIRHTQTRPSDELPHVNLDIDGKTVNFLIDTGSTVTTISEHVYQALNFRKLQPFHDEILGYPNNPLAVIGQFSVNIRSNSAIRHETIAVIKGEAKNLLSFFASEALSLITINTNTNHSIASSISINHTTPGWLYTVDDLCKRFPNLFKQTIGRIPNMKIKLFINESIVPVVQKPRHTPYHLRDKIELKLKRLLDDGVIRNAKGPISWVSSIVPVIKPNGDIRITTDSRSANEAIQRTRHPMPTPEDITILINGATHFSKLDIKESFYMLELHESSKYITVFRTHIGLFEFNCLNMGINAATEIFQSAIENILKNLKNTKNLIDDIIIWGTGQADHDTNLLATLSTLDQSNCTLNPNKCKFSVSKINFYGLELSSQGVKVMGDKIIALKSSKPPTTPKEIQSFMGLAQFCSKQIPKLASLAKPLTNLTRKANKWKWEAIHQNAFDQIKANIIDQAMGYYDKNWTTNIEVDAGPEGISSIVWQSNPKPPHETKIIKFDSRVLSDVETRYSQCEKEGLAAVWGCEKNELYLIGNRFNLITDNKGIELIFNNSKSKPPPRLHRMRLRLSPFNFNIIHRPGSTNIADYLSRHPYAKATEHLSSLCELHATHITNTLVPKAIKLEDVQIATEACPTLNKLIRQILIGRKNRDKELAPYMKVFRDLTLAPSGKLILKNQKLLIPLSLQEKMVQLAHQGHQGLVKTKKLLRSKVWFPGIDSMTEKLIRSCLPCNLNAPKSSPEPLQPTEMPAPWSIVALDHKGPLSNGSYALVMIDCGSRYTIIHQVKSTSFENNRACLTQTWTLFGPPKQVISDNGPPFQGEKFRNHCNDFGIKHRKTTPAWPKANGLAENFIKNITKATKNATASNTPIMEEIYQFLRAYNSTPHTSTGIPPVDLMFGRANANTSLIPIWPSNHTSIQLESAILNNQKAKTIQKAYYDAKNKTKTHCLAIGDKVMFDTRYDSKIYNKSQPRFDPNPYTVTHTKGSLITAKRLNKTITRNISYFKKL